MNPDPKLLIAGLCLFAISFLVALVLRQLRNGRLEAAIAPRPQAFAGLANAVTPVGNGVAKTPNGGHKVIAIIHDFGLPHGEQTDERRYLSTREAFEILSAIRSVSADTPIDVILHTPGGESFACELIATALKDRPNTTAYVPYCAMSAGTIIALSTERIVMGRYACLGPIDTQFFGFPIDSYTRLLKEKPIQNIDDFVILLGYLAEKELKTARQKACDLLNKRHFGKRDACQISDLLVSGDMPHSEQIGRERAIEIGINVAKEECPASVYETVEQRLQLYRSMDAQGGLGAEFQVKAPQDKSQPPRPATFASPKITWRRP